MIYVLDTDTLSLLHNGHERVARRAEIHQNDDIVTSVISRIEIMQGRFDFVLKAETEDEFARAQEWLHRTESLFQVMSILPITADTVHEFHRLRRMKGFRRIGRNDLVIASTALALNAIVVTRNVRDFTRVPRLKVENWVDN